MANEWKVVDGKFVVAVPGDIPAADARGGFVGYFLLDHDDATWQMFESDDAPTDKRWVLKMGGAQPFVAAIINPGDMIDLLSKLVQMGTRPRNVTRTGKPPPTAGP